MGSEVEVAVYGRRWYILLIFSLHAMFQVCTVLYCTVLYILLIFSLHAM